MMQQDILPCNRCGTPCKLGHTATEDAQLLRRATRPDTSGYCPECGVIDFFKHHSMLGEIIDGRGEEGHKMLLDERVQRQFAGLMQTGKADLPASHINWQRVVDLWDLPFPQRGKKRVKR